MAKPQTCSWKHCQHDSPEISGESAVQMSGRWYHADCAEISKGICAAKDYYYENISKTVVMNQLVAVLVNIVVTKKVSPEYVLFAMKYAVKNKMTLRSPYGLHYLVENWKVKEAWEKVQKRKQAAAIHKQMAEQKVSFSAPKADNSGKYDQTKTGFGSIFGS